MKKKLVLLALLTILFVCLFVVGVSAATYQSNYANEVTKFKEDGVEVGPDWANIDDKTSTAVLKLSNETYVRVPMYYVFKANSNNQFVTSGTNFDLGWISDKLGETETLGLESIIVVEIPQGTTSISGAFNGTNLPALEELVIPTSVTSLGQSMFRNNNVLKKVFIKQTKDADGVVHGVTTLPGWFADITNGTVSALEEFNFELDYVTSIGSNAFMNSALKSFTVTAPITSFGGTIFCGCKSLETVYINNTAETVSVGSKAFAGCTKIKSVTLNGFSLPDYLFENANGLTGGFTFKATNVTTLGTMPFKNSTNLEHVEISGPITNFGTSTFLGCTNLSTIKVVNTLDTPATCGNNMCDGLKKLTYVEMHGINVSGYAFRQAGDQTNGMVVKCTNAGLIGEAAFYKSYATEIYVSGPFTSIGNSTYRECPLLKELTVINTGDTVVTGGNGESNPMLERLHLEGKMKISGSPAFQNNTALKHVYVGTGVEELVAYCFYKCYALETMYLADTVAVINDRAIDMDASGKQTSASFMFVDENGNMDNTLPTSLTYIGGHFLKHFTIANTELIFPESFTSHTSEQAYDFEGTIYPEGFRLVYLGKMTSLNLKMFSKHNYPKDITIYLTQNSSSDIKNHRVTADFDGSTIKHGTYAGQNENGTLEIVIDAGLQNNINPTGYVKFYFCKTDEICFATRVNILWGTNTSSSWGNFISTPVTYAQLEAAYKTYNDANEIDKVLPAKHIHDASKDKTTEATCTLPAGSYTFCFCGSVITEDIVEGSVALGHIEGVITIYYPVVNGVPNYFANAHHSYVCGRAGCIIDEEKEGTALFTEKGYSKEEYEGGSAFTYGISLNKAAEKEYVENGNTISYGFIIGSPSDNATGEIMNADGTTNLGKYILTDFAESEYKNFSIYNVRMFGLSDAQKAQEIYCCAYVIDAEKVYYVGENITAAAKTVSFEQIKA